MDDAENEAGTGEPTTVVPVVAVPGLALPGLALPENQLAIRRATHRLCGLLGWSVLHELPLPNGRRADVMALRPDGDLACIEIKSGPRDYLSDLKWPEYRDCSDALFFAVDERFPQDLLPPDVGIIVACTGGLPPSSGVASSAVVAEAEIVRDAPAHRLSAPTRRKLLQRFATVAANRLALLEDPAITASVRAATRVE
ncbi:MAG: MmcB family DNA repair protein [Gluconacetobacter diazotrophicus]|nr:MmcB family DNA repair protein [Gluconacetobacter diazotrophicus]